jgi:hypothetical protein
MPSNSRARSQRDLSKRRSRDSRLPAKSAFADHKREFALAGVADAGMVN